MSLSPFSDNDNLGAAAPSFPDSNLARTRDAFRARSMASMGRTVGVLVGAGVLGAIYQIITEEARSQLQGIRQRAHLKRVRRDAVLIKLLGTELSPELQLALAVSRKPYETAIRLLALPQISTRDKELIRDTLQHAIKIQPSS